MIHTKEKQYTILNQSCLDAMDSMEENSIDAIVTDPPYEIGFMGKKWDNTGIAFSVETWQKALRVLKPGGYLLAFNHSRTFHRMMVAIEDAGFELRDTIMYLYGSGFPKSHNISKAIDKKGGNPLIVKEIAEALKLAREEKGLSKSYCDEMFCNLSTNWSWYEGRNGVARIPNEETFNKICELFPSLNKYKEDIKELQTIIGSKMQTNGVPLPNQTGRKQQEFDITTPTSDLAKQWKGYGTALKPAFEPIVMARKPFKTTVAENILKYGVGGINIDECRIGNEEIKTSVGAGFGGSFEGGTKERIESISQGRFPANIIHNGNEETISGFPNTKSGDSNGFVGKDTNKIFGKYQNNIINKDNIYADEGSASRYFYTAKASVKDRDEGLDDFETKAYGQSGGAQQSIREGKDEYIQENHIGLNKIKHRKNIHPTVKPTDLMQYLIRLVAPKGAIILDPFMGSGSTGKAAMIENTERNANYHFIGIDLEKEYCDIAKARIEWGINFRQLEDKHILYDDQGNKEKAIQDKFDLFGEKDEKI